MGEAKEMSAAIAMQPEWMTPVEVAELLRMKERTLEGKRLAGNGPDYYRKGPGNKTQILYRREDVYAWMEKFKVRQKAG